MKKVILILLGLGGLVVLGRAMHKSLSQVYPELLEEPDLEEY